MITLNNSCMVCRQASHMSVALQKVLVILFQLLIGTTEGSLVQDVSGNHLQGELDWSNPKTGTKGAALGWNEMILGLDFQYTNVFIIDSPGLMMASVVLQKTSSQRLGIETETNERPVLCPWNLQISQQFWKHELEWWWAGPPYHARRGPRVMPCFLVYRPIQQWRCHDISPQMPMNLIRINLVAAKYGAQSQMEWLTIIFGLPYSQWM